MLNGIINIYKEPGYTSHDVVAKLRGITHQKKIGHTGTLDPDAEGVLCVCLGAATRVCDMFTDATKAYEAVCLLGTVTDTQDTSGQVLSEKPVDVSAETVRDCIAGFIGDTEQIPPMYSALKRDGKKLYELARAGIEVEREPRHITIYDIEIVNIDLPEVTMRVTCSKGTYIRTLCNDIGEKLGCGGCMKHLTRIRVGDFDISTAHKLSEVEELAREDRISDVLIPVTSVFADLPAATVTQTGASRAMNGNLLRDSDLIFEDSGLHNTTLVSGNRFRVLGPDGFFYGIYSYDAGDDACHPVKMFLCQ
ncbi:MAG: tRNA pseudouridine(55) synthase TruB [Lachnospiraceae bacterium]|nr:tRNA pseudouridine(55) synthase TruB [Lachnospiraceae bacterium]